MLLPMKSLRKYSGRLVNMIAFPPAPITAWFTRPFAENSTEIRLTTTTFDIKYGA